VRPTGWKLAVAAVAALAVGLGSNLAPASQAGGAEADRTGLARFHRQQLEWHTCQQGPQDEEGRALDQAGAQCAEVTVPLDYARPGGRTVKVAISRLRATDTAGRIGPMLINLGGPAIPVLARVVDARLAMGATGTRFDLIGMDPRLTGRSSPVDCGWPSSWIPRSAGATRRSFDRMVALAGELARRCARRHGDLLPHASTANIARDMDVIRGALGAPKLSFLGYSYGSYLGALYAQRFGDRAGRIVLDSAIDPADPGPHVRGENAPAREQGLRDWAAWAARHDPQYHLGATAGQVLATVDRVYQASARRPLRVGRHRVDDTAVPALLVGPLSDDGDGSNAELASLVRVLARAAAGGAAEPTPELDRALAGMLTGADSAFHSGQTAIMCADQAVPRDPEWYWRNLQQRRARHPLFGPMDRIISPCAFWPSRPRQPRVRNGVPALIVHADGDINATAELNRAMHRALTGSRMITLEGVRTHGVYLFQGSGCVDGAVNAYLDGGSLPARDLACARPAA
jgi:pimeloyl-ACP methyl ester carboxylesterase